LSEESKNLFSKQSAAYAKYRPRYPKAIFEFLIPLARERRRVWDCATGNGQAAVDLAPYFDEVIATDSSEAQIKNAMAHPKIKYAVAPAEKTSIEPQSVDLVTVAQAAHWLDHEFFYREARRVLKPEGVIAMWCYGHNRKIDPQVGPIYKKYSELVDPFWAPQIRYIWEELKTIPFPFAEIQAPSLTMEAHWDLSAFTGYLWSWSATQKYIEQTGANPLAQMEEEMKRAWGPPEISRKMTWPVYFRVGRL
jgi:ubiquinone/menaquinone biosynthesis C-methylase UbiE